MEHRTAILCSHILVHAQFSCIPVADGNRIDVLQTSVDKHLFETVRSELGKLILNNLRKIHTVIHGQWSFIANTSLKPG